MLQYLTENIEPFTNHSDTLPETINMYMMSRMFPWCSPEYYRTMSEWDKSVYLAILKGEGEASKNENNPSHKSPKKPNTKSTKRKKNARRPNRKN